MTSMVPMLLATPTPAELMPRDTIFECNLDGNPPCPNGWVCDCSEIFTCGLGCVQITYACIPPGSSFC